MRTSSVLLLLLAAGVARSADPILVARPDAFATLVNPNCSHCRDEAKRQDGESYPEQKFVAWNNHIARSTRHRDLLQNLLNHFRNG